MRDKLKIVYPHPHTSHAGGINIYLDTPFIWNYAGDMFKNCLLCGCVDLDKLLHSLVYTICSGLSVQILKVDGVATLTFIFLRGWWVRQSCHVS